MCVECVEREREREERDRAKSKYEKSGIIERKMLLIAVPALCLCRF